MATTVPTHWLSSSFSTAQDDGPHQTSNFLFAIRSPSGWITRSNPKSPSCLSARMPGLLLLSRLNAFQYSTFQGKMSYLFWERSRLGTPPLPHDSVPPGGFTSAWPGGCFSGNPTSPPQSFANGFCSTSYLANSNGHFPRARACASHHIGPGDGCASRQDCPGRAQDLL